MIPLSCAAGRRQVAELADLAGGANLWENMSGGIVGRAPVLVKPG